MIRNRLIKLVENFTDIYPKGTIGDIRNKEFVDQILQLIEEEVIGGFERTSGTTVPMYKKLIKKGRNQLRQEQRTLLKNLEGKK